MTSKANPAKTWAVASYPLRYISAKNNGNYKPYFWLYEHQRSVKKTVGTPTWQLFAVPMPSWVLNMYIYIYRVQVWFSWHSLASFQESFANKSTTILCLRVYTSKSGWLVNHFPHDDHPPIVPSWYRDTSISTMDFGAL